MSNYTTLVADRDHEGSIKHWANDSRIPSTTILTEAQAWIYAKLRVRQMLLSTQTVVAKGDDTITLPTGYKAPYLFRWIGVVGAADQHSSIPQYRLLDFVLSQFTYDGTGARTRGIPQYYATDESNVQFEVELDVARNYLFTYYRALPNLDSSTNLTNFLTDDYPYLLRAACLHRAFEHLRNSREKAYWLAIAEGQINEARVDSDLELAGVEMQMEIE